MASIKVALELVDKFSRQSQSAMSGFAKNASAAMTQVKKKWSTAHTDLAKSMTTKIAKALAPDNVTKTAIAGVKRVFGSVEKNASAAAATAKGAWQAVALGIVSYFSVGAIKSLLMIGDVETKLKSMLNVAFQGGSATDVWMGKVRGISSSTGVAAEKVAKNIAILREFGMKGERALVDTAAAMADVDMMGGNSDAFIQARKQLRDLEIQGKKTISGGELSAMWKSTGLDPARIVHGLKELNDFKGKTDEELMRMLQQGQIKTSQAEAAMRAAVQKATGKPLGGLAMDTAGKGIEGLTNKLQNLWTESVVGSKDFKELQELFMQFFTGSIGERVKAVVGHVVGVLATFGKIIGYVIGGLIFLPEMLYEIGSGIWESGKAMLHASLAIGTAIMAILTSGPLQTLIDMAGTIAGVGLKIGSALVDGFMEGISRITKMGGKIKDYFISIPDGIRSALGIHSPSKVFAEMGKFSMLGFVQGFESTPMELPSISGAIASPPVVQAGQSSNSASQTNNVTYNAGQPSGDSYEQFRRFLVRSLQGVMEEAGIPVAS